MRYIIFADRGCYYNSIIRVCDKDLPTIKATGLVSGYGGFRIHEASGGYVFEGLDMLRHFFQGARDIFGCTQSTFGSQTFQEKEDSMNHTNFMYNFCVAHKIKKEEEMVGGMNADIHHEDPDRECYREFLDYLETEEKVEYKRQLKFIEEARIYLAKEEENWKIFHQRRRAEKLLKENK